MVYTSDRGGADPRGPRGLRWMKERFDDGSYGSSGLIRRLVIV